MKDRMEKLCAEDPERCEELKQRFKKRRESDEPGEKQTDSEGVARQRGGIIKTALKPEMTANVEIIIARKEEALIVPVEAVSRQKGQQYVSVITGEENN